MVHARYKFSVELCAPLKPESFRSYTERFAALLAEPLVYQVNLASIRVGSIAGFDRSHRLAVHLHHFYPQLEILFHVTCHDLNRVNISHRLESLRALGVSKFLVITGEHYEVPQIGRELHFVDSSELASYMATNFGWIQSIGVAAYPGGKPPSTCNNSDEAERVARKLSSPKIETVYTQCVFSSHPFIEFCKLLGAKLDGIRSLSIVPSVAIFKDKSSFQRTCRLTRVGDPDDLEAAMSEMLDVTCPNGLGSSEVAGASIAALCRSLRSENGLMIINICTFGLFEQARELIRKLTEDAA